MSRMKQTKKQPMYPHWEVDKVLNISRNSLPRELEIYAVHSDRDGNFFYTIVWADSRVYMNLTQTDLEAALIRGNEMPEETIIIQGVPYDQPGHPSYEEALKTLAQWGAEDEKPYVDTL